ncbi:S-layer homology domain-containing protein [Oscillibacter sp.]
MTWAVGQGILNGTSDGKLNPTGSTTRAQFAVILNRFAAKLG